MAVRNVRSPSTTRLPKPIPVIHVIPPAFAQIWKIEIITTTETYDVTNYILDGEYTDGVTGTIGEFKFTIDNSTQVYSDTVDLWNQVKVYMNYGSVATNHVFTGYIEKPSKTNHQIIITGRSGAARATGVNVTYEATNKARSTVLTEIIEKYFDGILTTTNLEADTTLINVSYFEVPFWEVIESLCGDAGYDAYVDKDLDFHYFVADSRTNSTDAISETVNLLDTGEFAPDLEQTYNKVRIYGQEQDGIPIIATYGDASLQASYDIKTLKINDSSVINETQAKEKAQYELAKNKSPPTIGTVTSFLLPTIQPGEKMAIANPLNKIVPAYYKIYKYTHKFGNGMVPTTTITIQKERLDVANIMKQRINFESKITSNPNPNEMDFSLKYDFSTAVGTFSNTQRVLIDSSTGGYYVLTTISGNSGTWTSPNTIFTPDTISALEFRIIGDSLAGSSAEGTTIEYSLDGGIVFNTWTSGDVIVPSKGQLQIRVTLSSSETQVKAVAALYKL